MLSNPKLNMAIHHLHQFLHQTSFLPSRNRWEWCKNALYMPIYKQQNWQDGFNVNLDDFVPTMKSLDSDNKKSAEKAPEVKEEVKEEVIDFSKVEIEPMFKDFVDFDSFSKCDFRAVKVKACEAVKKSKKLLQFTLDDGTGTDRTILSGIHAYYEPEELVGKTLVAITNLPPRAMMGIDSCGMLLSAVHTEEGEEKLHLLMVDNHIPAGAKLY